MHFVFALMSRSTTFWFTSFCKPGRSTIYLFKFSTFHSMFACSAKIQRSYLWFKWFCCERNYLKSEAVTPQPQSDFSASPDQLLASLPARAGGTLNRSSSGRTTVKARKYHMFSDLSLINQLMINFPVSARRRQSCGVHLRWDERRYRGSLGTKSVVTG